jgi:hypothetical protein
MAGRISYFGGIVTNGLVLNLDAAKKDSYPGTGTAWNDISGNRNNGTLTNGPTFDPANGGSIVFDGVDDYTEIPSNPTLSVSSQITISCWCYLNANSETMIRKNTADYLLDWGSGASSTAGTNLQWYLSTSLGPYFIYSTSALSLNTWYNIVGTYISGTGGVIYANSNVIPSTTSINNRGTITQSNSYLRVGNFGTEKFSGKVATVQIYNRALSSTEITQNYNATKGRYGL